MRFRHPTSGQELDYNAPWIWIASLGPLYFLFNGFWGLFLLYAAGLLLGFIFLFSALVLAGADIGFILICLAFYNACFALAGPNSIKRHWVKKGWVPVSEANPDRPTAGGWALLVVMLALFSMLLALAGKTAQPLSPSSAVQSDYRQIRYEVRGTMDQAITYTNKTGGTSQTKIWQPPWTLELSAPPGFHAYISSQGQTNMSKVKVRIYVDGVLWKSSDSDGPYCIASASGFVP